ncbi:hypothetical protein [Synoicihabitans lomoniglobus]|uniref:Uncharacterized protein n=1 Tax=Synoicihabitans lomoniglobus TaxID=2909285 RepID=A0AAF0CP31_9BACT|nr:hypothetical protein [Opitutaceae bacterium LMO-M01]WED65511.1 hypothetical protein PXH66_01440 [Opitutaceae bacterium LMO-M01]
MSHIIEIDQLLIEIASPLSKEADTILDLRAAASAQPHPGRCVMCYFKLLAAAPSVAVPRLTSLRRWLEARIEIAATRDSGDVLETMPLDLSTATDLESCCQRTINTILEDRDYRAGAPAVALQFRFRPATAA